MLEVNSDFILIVSALFSSAWKIATSFRIPGTNLNIPEFSLAMTMVWFSIRHVPKILDLDPGINKDGDDDVK